MAISKDNIVTEGLSGMIGDVIVFRQVRGKTIIANRPRKPSRESDLQRENRVRFRQASAFAKHVMQDPEKKQYYLAKARKLKLPNAYTAAITDYMRKPAVTAIKYKGNAQGNIAITAGKAGFSLASVTVTMVDALGMPLATSTATLKDRLKNEWIARLVPNPQAPYKTDDGDCLTLARRSFLDGRRFSEGGKIMVTAADYTGNVVSNMLAA